MTQQLGFGFCPLGVNSIFGFGSPETDDQPSPGLLEETPGGVLGDARFIDPIARDYVIDANGNVTGTSSVAQQVYLALTTIKGSAADFTLGNEFASIKTINPATIKAQVSNYVQRCLAHLIKPGLITIVSLVVQQDVSVSSRLLCNLTWTDNTASQATQATTFTLG